MAKLGPAFRFIFLFLIALQARKKNKKDVATVGAMGKVGFFICKQTKYKKSFPFHLFCTPIKYSIFGKTFDKYTAIMKNTSQEYDSIISKCRTLFSNKMSDYGSAWRILRLPSLTDQIFIKAQRLRSLQENKIQKIADDASGEFIGIINYSVMALIQIELGIADQPDLELAKAIQLYDEKIAQTKQLMEAKNHDYSEAWREIRISSLTDLILQKLLRVKQIENNQGKTIVSEGIDANYQDMLNYAVFALILMSYQK